MLLRRVVCLFTQCHGVLVGAFYFDPEKRSPGTRWTSLTALSVRLIIMKGGCRLTVESMSSRNEWRSGDR